jgi:transcriptional adapter 3
MHHHPDNMANYILPTGAPAPPSPVIAPKTDAPDLMDTADSPSDSDDSNAEPPSTAPLYERAFGKDPTLSYDPTIYDIRELHDDMTDEEKRAILNVGQWPESDLSEMTAGDPPDEDFSKQKPQNQVSAATFASYVEPFIRPFTEEDVAFLKERPDRVTPFLIPQRGPRGYKEVWAAEDGMEGVAAPRQRERERNEARGSMEEMGDEVAETDEVSLGPVMGRLLSIIRPTPSKKKDDKDNKDANKNDDEADGDTTMVNGIDGLPNGIESQDPQALPGAEVEHKPATYLPPDAPRLPHLVPADYETLEQRAIQELRHIGFLPPNDLPDFSAQNDDEVAARLRTLQHELRRISRINNVRKARVLELTEERMAMQEYANIADDLDNQVNAAYLKRNRTLSKTPSHKKGGSHQSRPGQAKGLAGAGGFGARGVSDGVRALMQKRRDWIEMVGPVVSFGRPPIPGDGETVFDEGNLRRLERVEREMEAEAGEGDAEGE